MILLIGSFIFGLVVGITATYKLLDPDNVWEEGFNEGREYERKHGDETV